ncbi:hypothetical protein AAF712_007766 [Marasmius tenuissimus]|uniref:Inositol polyphosphate-related phosphatase domain-containing protein n=1 Tax=Marasmius tenuissimus TaxID=585030 RepID=A0ABR2ZVC7_9AGAR
MNGVHATNDLHTKPAVPPRKPSKTISSESLLPGIPSSGDTLFTHHAHTKSSSSHSNSSSSSINLLDDSSSDDTELTVDEGDLSSVSTSTTTLPPTLPARKIRLNDDASTNSLSTKSTPTSHRTSPVPPPRPPPRHRSTPETFLEANMASPPPPLPARRGTTFDTSSAPPRHPNASTPSLYHPPPPHRIHPTSSVSSITDTNFIASPVATTPIASSSLNGHGAATERKAFGKLPPPPTRTIAPGDKLPPARRPPTPSSDEDEDSDDEEVKGPGVDMLPDSSNSSRRPPHLLVNPYESPVHGYPGVAPGTDNRIHVPAHSGHLVVTNGHVVVGQSHYLKVFDIGRSVDVPLMDLDLKVLVREIRGSSATVSALEIRCSNGSGDDKGKATERGNSGVGGNVVWVGTKEGHLIEVNVKSGEITGWKYSAHMHPIVHILRYGSAMVSIDDSGKALIFGSPEPVSPSADADMLKTTPRVMRVTDKLEFTKVVCGLLWTAGRSDAQVSGTHHRVPVIRIYDLFPTPGAAGGKIGSGKSIMPTEPVGSVRCAAVVPSQPGFVYVGHEGGCISIWDLGEDSGYGKELPKCLEIMKVSGSDVMSLEGVNDRLWVGSRNGMITVYDTTPRPWLLTNSWNAHPGLPVNRLTLDVWGVKEGKRRLCVASVGRNEKVGLWDGLLAADWMDKELLKHESKFSTFRELKVLIVSWNCDSARPDSLTGNKDNVNFLHDVLTSLNDEGGPDIIAFGLQEVIDLESRKMVAKNVILGGPNATKKSKALAVASAVASSSTSTGDETALLGLSDKVTGAYKRWYDALVLAVRLAMPPECPYSVIHTESLIGLFSCIFVKHSERGALKDLAITTVKRGMGGRYGNKGGIISRFVIEDSSLCFINCHLAAGQHALRSRNADVAGMLEEKMLFPTTMEPQAFVGGGDGSMVLDHETVFVNGDMNYRIDQRRDAIVAAVKAGEHESMQAHDQLLKEIKYNRGCRFRTFSEGPLTFPPTYKYDRRSNEYDSSEKRRAPAWCDRVLWKAGKGRVEQLQYRRWEVDVSDHRPISAAFKVTVKSVRQEVRQMVKQEIEFMWAEEEARIVKRLEDYYRQNLVYTMGDVDESAKLWKVNRTLHEMVRDRGFQVSDEEINMDLQTFRDGYASNMGSVDRSQLNFFSSSRADPTDQIFVFFSDEKSVGVKTMRKMLEILEQKSISRGILVFPGNMTPSARKVIVTMAAQFRLEEFSESDLLVNITHHLLVPKHEVLSSEDKKILLER